MKTREKTNRKPKETKTMKAFPVAEILEGGGHILLSTAETDGSD